MAWCLSTDSRVAFRQLPDPLQNGSWRRTNYRFRVRLTFQFPTCLPLVGGWRSGHLVPDPDSYPDCVLMESIGVRIHRFLEQC